MEYLEDRGKGGGSIHWNFYHLAQFKFQMELVLSKLISMKEKESRGKQDVSLLYVLHVKRTLSIM
jgi:hypothetical protein